MMKSAEFEEVVKSRLFTSATPETIEIVGEFSILYGIFEARFFRRPCSSKSGEVRHKVKFITDEKKILKEVTVGDASASYQYFRRRYLLDEEKGPSRFESLDMSSSLENRIRELLYNAKSGNEKRYAVIIIMNALRNNLFHGVKGTDSFNENREFCGSKFVSSQHIKLCSSKPPHFQILTTTPAAYLHYCRPCR